MGQGQSKDCIFCKIVRRDAGAAIAWEDERTLVFMDLFPVHDGHTLIIPKAHCENLFEADPEDLEAVIRCSKRVAHALEAVLRPDGLGVYQLNGAAAGQTVFHYHMHLVPRTEGDPLTLHGRKQGDAARLEELAALLHSAMQGT